jgi:hypothetical protein
MAQMSRTYPETAAHGSSRATAAPEAQRGNDSTPSATMQAVIRAIAPQ